MCVTISMLHAFLLPGSAETSGLLVHASHEFSYHVMVLGFLNLVRLSGLGNALQSTCNNLCGIWTCIDGP